MGGTLSCALSTRIVNKLGLEKEQKGVMSMVNAV